MGWGVMVGKTDLTDPVPIGGIPGSRYRGWRKELRPGVWLYAH